VDPFQMTIGIVGLAAAVPLGIVWIVQRAKVERAWAAAEGAKVEARVAALEEEVARLKAAALAAPRESERAFPSREAPAAPVPIDAPASQPSAG
jgi:outer membrane murein-binding lipoprotein Lpp